MAGLAARDRRTQGIEELVLAAVGAVAAASVVSFNRQTPANPGAVNRSAAEDPAQNAWAFQRPERIVEGFVLMAFADLLAGWNFHGFSLEDGLRAAHIFLTIGAIFEWQKRSHGRGLRSAASLGYE